jgi:hypothetical protein
MLPNIPKKWSGKLHGFQRHFPSKKSSPDKFSSRESAKSFHPDGRHCYNVTRHCALLYLPLTLYSCLHSFCFFRPASFFLRDLKTHPPTRLFCLLWTFFRHQRPGPRASRHYRHQRPGPRASRHYRQLGYFIILHFLEFGLVFPEFHFNFESCG